MSIAPFFDDIAPQEQPDRKRQSQNQQHIPRSVINPLFFFIRQPLIPRNRRSCDFPKEHRRIGNSGKEVLRRNQDILFRNQVPDKDTASGLRDNGAQASDFRFEQISLNNSAFIAIHNRGIFRTHLGNSGIFAFPVGRLRPQSIQSVLHIFRVFLNSLHGKFNHQLLLRQKGSIIFQTLSGELFFLNIVFNFRQLSRNGFVVKSRCVGIYIINNGGLLFRCCFCRRLFSRCRINISPTNKQHARHQQA